MALVMSDDDPMERKKRKESRSRIDIVDIDRKSTLSKEKAE